MGRARREGLSPREREVLELLGEHLTHAEIAQRLFLSIRTVESHVASLRRKLTIDDHRALVRYAADRLQSRQLGAGFAALPAPLSSFIGRETELLTVQRAIASSRLVTVLGPGGIGKTRLAVTAAATVTDRDHTAYSDLVPITDPDAVAQAVATATGVSEPGRGRSFADAIVDQLRGRDALLVLDNAEHVVHAVTVLVERLLRDCAALRVLVTSRVRLVAPFEHVVSLGGLASAETETDLSVRGDAETLFLERGIAAGARLEADDLAAVRRICTALDGVPLALELAAARVPSLGLDGVERGLARHDTLLIGAQRLEARHASLHGALAWSYDLLGPTDRSVLRRVCTFQAPFRLSDAAVVAARGLTESEVEAALGRLVEHSLLSTVTGHGTTRYRALETVRQFGVGLLAANGDDAHFRHFEWANENAARLTADSAGTATWAAAFDAVANDLRAATAWARAACDARAAGHDLERQVSWLLFLRGHTTLAQAAYQAAADTAPDRPAAAACLATAGDVARCRVNGPEAVALDEAAATAWNVAGRSAQAAGCLARAAETLSRFAGMFETSPSSHHVTDLLNRAREAAGDDRVARLAVASAACQAGDVTTAELEGLIGESVALADAVTRSALLDRLTVVRLDAGDTKAAFDAAEQRLAPLRAAPLEPAVGLELKDALHMAVHLAIAVGELAAAVRYGLEHATLPHLREEPDLAMEDSIAPCVLAGEWTVAADAASRCLAVWHRSGYPTAAARAFAPAAAVLLHGLLEDDDERLRWEQIRDTIHGPRATTPPAYQPVFDAIVQLHHDEPERALACLAYSPADPFWGAMFEGWRRAVAAEAFARLSSDSGPDGGTTAGAGDGYAQALRALLAKAAGAREASTAIR
jgi:predicted ATPase/DNA-binding CsgD family transcriptional regulator